MNLTTGFIQISSTVANYLVIVQDDKGSIHERCNHALDVFP